jgi:hypothetical protein
MEVFVQRSYSQSFLAQKSNLKPGFLDKWFSPWLFVGFLLSLEPFTDDFKKTKVFLCSQIFSILFYIKMRTKRKYYSFSSYKCCIKQRKALKHISEKKPPSPPPPTFSAVEEEENQGTSRKPRK